MRIAIVTGFVGLVLQAGLALGQGAPIGTAGSTPLLGAPSFVPGTIGVGTVPTTVAPTVMEAQPAPTAPPVSGFTTSSAATGVEGVPNAGAGASFAAPATVAPTETMTSAPVEVAPPEASAVAGTVQSLSGAALYNYWAGMSVATSTYESAVHPTAPGATAPQPPDVSTYFTEGATATSVPGISYFTNGTDATSIENTNVLQSTTPLPPGESIYGVAGGHAAVATPTYANTRERPSIYDVPGGNASIADRSGSIYGVPGGRASMEPGTAAAPATEQLVTGVNPAPVVAPTPQPTQPAAPAQPNATPAQPAQAPAAAPAAATPVQPASTPAVAAPAASGAGQ